MGESQPSYHSEVLTFMRLGAAGTLLKHHRHFQEKHDVAYFSPEQTPIVQLLEFLAAYPGAASLVAIRDFDALPLQMVLGESDEGYAQECWLALITEIQKIAQYIAGDTEGLAQYFEIVFSIGAQVLDFDADWRSVYEDEKIERGSIDPAAVRLERVLPVKFIFSIRIDMQASKEETKVESDLETHAQEYLWIHDTQVPLETDMAKIIRFLELQRTEEYLSAHDENPTTAELTAHQLCELLGDTCPEPEAEKYVWECFNRFRQACAAAGVPHFSQMIRYRMDLEHHRMYFSLGEVFISKEELPQERIEDRYHSLKLPVTQL